MRETTSTSAEVSSGDRPLSLARGWKRLLADGAEAWGWSQSTMLLVMLIPGLVLLSGVVSALMGKPAYKWFTGEDRFAENLQVVIWTTALVLAVRVTNVLRNEGQKTWATLYICLCVGLVFIIGEEVSWGQRFIGWTTPETLKELNKQKETNIHNLQGVGLAFKWFKFLVGAYGTLMPLVVMRSSRLRRYRDQLALLVPHYTLIPFFLVVLVWRTYRNLFEAPKAYYFAISEFTEVVEVVLAFGFMFFLLFQWRRLRRNGLDGVNGRT